MQLHIKLKSHIKNLLWRYNDNLLPTILFNIDKIKKKRKNDSTSYEVRRIIDDISRNGYAVSEGIVRKRKYAFHKRTRKKAKNRSSFW